MISIGVVGGGVGGLTLALALREAGFANVRVYEAGAADAVANRGLVLSPNATRVLHALGLKDALRDRCGHPRIQLQRAWSGFLLVQRPLGRAAADRYGAPHCCIGRATLLQVLRDACRSRGVTITDNQTCTNLSQSDRDVVVEAGGRRTRHDVVVGCDGPTSLVRGHLHYPPESTAKSGSAWWGYAPIETLHRPLTLDAITTWLGPRQYLTHWPSPDGHRIEFMAVTVDGGSDPQAALPVAHPHLGVLLRNCDQLRVDPLTDHAPISQWYDRRVALLGDACHAMGPHLQQGAALAIEDAWVLARMLERWEDQPAGGFTDYQRYRKVRVARVRQANRLAAAQWCLEAPYPRLLRNLRISLTSRFLPEMAIQQLDWLYGYDCVRGFE